MTRDPALIRKYLWRRQKLRHLLGDTSLGSRSRVTPSVGARRAVFPWPDRCGSRPPWAWRQPPGRSPPAPCFSYSNSTITSRNSAPGSAAIASRTAAACSALSIPAPPRSVFSSARVPPHSSSDTVRAPPPPAQAVAREVHRNRKHPRPKLRPTRNFSRCCHTRTNVSCANSSASLTVTLRST